MNTVPVGLATKAGLVTAAGAFASALIIYLTGDHTAQQVTAVEVAAGHHITAPGYGYVVKYGYDGPWDKGFGSPYMFVRIVGNSGFAGGPNNGEYYIGHVNANLLRPGEWFHTGQAIGFPTHS